MYKNAGLFSKHPKAKPMVGAGIVGSTLLFYEAFYFSVLLKYDNAILRFIAILSLFLIALSFLVVFITTLLLMQEMIEDKLKK